MQTTVINENATFSALKIVHYSFALKNMRFPFNMGIFNGVFPEIYYPLSSPNYIDQKLACQIIDHLKYSLTK